MKRISLAIAAAALTVVLLPRLASAAEQLDRIDQRYASAKTPEEPNFQRHVMPLLGRMGCNGRACHGSFQGRGGFQLSLFGYDFKGDHKALLGGDEPRVNTEKPDESLIIFKPTNEDEHEGGERYKQESWQHHVLRRWIESGAVYDEKSADKLVELKIIPSEIIFNKAGEKKQLKAVAIWSDGTQEDVTPLCRFKSNSSQVAKVDARGLITADKPGDTHVVVFYDNGVVPISVMRPVSDKIGAKYPQVATANQVDKLVIEKLKKLGVVPSEQADDAQFLRRLSLDLTGTLPSPKQIEAFLADKSPDKRAKIIEELLSTPAYAAWWTTKLCDLTGNNLDALNNVTPKRGRASQDWYDWIYKRVDDNVAYDKLVEGIVLANSRNEGESYMQFAKAMSATYQDGGKTKYADRDSMAHYWARRTFTKPEDRVIGFAYTFLGVRIQCAQCHKHPFDRWSKDDFAQFKGFFTRIGTRGVSPESKADFDKLTKQIDLKGKKGGQGRKELEKLLAQGKAYPFQEVYAVKPRKQPANKNNKNRNRKKNKNRNRRNVGAASAKLLAGETIDLTKLDDARKPLMDWLRAKDNPYFARAFVNRVWANYFNVGIVEPADDMSLANPPSNAPLLDYLSHGFIDSGFDMKWLHREITNSRTYQTSWVPNETNKMDQRNFSHAIVRRLPAEVAYDAIRQATAADVRVETMQQDLAGRAIAIAGVSSRNRGRGAGPEYALMVFGRSTRQSNCDCDRSNEASLLQTVYLQNDRDVLAMIDRAPRGSTEGGWVNQVARELGIKQRPAPTARKRRPPEVQKRIAQMAKRMRKLRQAGKTKEARSMQQKIAALVRRFPAGPAFASQKSGKVEAASMDTEKIVRQAYLRTVSRYPSDKEMATAKSYIESSDDTLGGIRGLLWALLNTKEFIVNH